MGGVLSGYARGDPGRQRGLLQWGWAQAEAEKERPVPADLASCAPRERSVLPALLQNFAQEFRRLTTIVGAARDRADLLGGAGSQSPLLAGSNAGLLLRERGMLATSNAAVGGGWRFSAARSGPQPSLAAAGSFPARCRLPVARMPLPGWGLLAPVADAAAGAWAAGAAPSRRGAAHAAQPLLSVLCCAVPCCAVLCCRWMTSSARRRA